MSPICNPSREIVNRLQGSIAVLAALHPSRTNKGRPWQSRKRSPEPSLGRGQCRVPVERCPSAHLHYSDTHIQRSDTHIQRRETAAHHLPHLDRSPAREG